MDHNQLPAGLFTPERPSGNGGVDNTVRHISRPKSTRLDHGPTLRCDTLPFAAPWRARARISRLAT